MRTYRLTKKDRNLIQIAKEVILENRIDNDLISCTVGSALMTDEGRIYKGVNIHS